MPKIANKTVNYSIYGRINSRMKYLNDTTSCQLPSIETQTDSIKGAGILGEIDMPSYGQIGSMTFSHGCRVDGEDAAILSAPVVQEFEVRWVTDKFDSSNSKIGIDAHKAIIKCIPKKYDPGKIEPGSAMDGSNEYEAIYYKKILNGKSVIEIDKLNNVLIINDVDYASQIRAAL
jgi:P2 family phage contractile tail tube protein